MAKANRQLQKFNRELQWKRGLRVSVSQGDYISEIWACENGIWASYFGLKDNAAVEYFKSFKECMKHILESAEKAGLKIEGLEKSLIRETKLATKRGLLSDLIIARQAHGVSAEDFSLAQARHELVKAGKTVNSENRESSCTTDCCC